MCTSSTAAPGRERRVARTRGEEDEQRPQALAAGRERLAADHGDEPRIRVRPPRSAAPRGRRGRRRARASRGSSRGSLSPPRVQRNDPAREQPPANVLEARLRAGGRRARPGRGSGARSREGTCTRRLREGPCPSSGTKPVEPEPVERREQSARLRDLEDRHAARRAAGRAAARRGRARGRRGCGRRSRPWPRRSSRRRTGSASTSPCTHSISRDLRARALEHPLARSRGRSRSPPACERGDREVAGAAARVEHAVARPHDRSRRSRAASAGRARASSSGSSRRRPARCGRTSSAPRRARACRSRRSLTRPTAAHELVLEPELVEAARDDEVDEVVHRRWPRGRSRARGRARSRPPAARAACSRGGSRERRLARAEHELALPSLSATLAARWIRFDIAPEAIVPSVPIEHGQIT